MASRRNTLEPVNPFHSREILLEEFLQPGEISQAAFVRKIRWTNARSMNSYAVNEA